LIAKDSDAVLRVKLGTIENVAEVTILQENFDVFGTKDVFILRNQQLAATVMLNLFQHPYLHEGIGSETSSE
jgi:hypothetical protein